MFVDRFVCSFADVFVRIFLSNFNFIHFGHVDPLICIFMHMQIVGSFWQWPNQNQRPNKKAQLSLTNPRDAFWRIVVYGVGVFVCVNV